MLIDCSYFVEGTRHILNASVGKMPNVNAEEVNAAIVAYIKEYQKEYLIRMLGYSLGNKINSYIESIPDYEFILRSGIHNKKTDRLYDESIKFFGGFNHIEINPTYDPICTQLCDSFADYVFFKILRDSISQATITGVVRLKSANDYVSPIRRQVSVWNAMVEKHMHFVEWCDTTDCHLSGITTDSNMLTKINTLNL